MRISDDNYRSAQGCVIVLGKERGDRYSPPKVADDVCRIGFVITKKIGCAVIRNKIRRRFREAVMLTLPRFRLARYDYVIIAGKNCAKASYQDIVQGLHNAFREIKQLHHKYEKRKKAAFLSLNPSDTIVCTEQRQI